MKAHGDWMLTGKTFVITGCLQGIGKETLKVFAENGSNVFACSFKEDEEFESFCKDLAQKNNVRIIPVYFDMMDDESIKKAAMAIQKEKMPINGLVNIAGMNKDAYFGMITSNDMKMTFQVNVFAQITFSQYISKMLKRNEDGGSILFTSSITAMDGNEGQTVYGASKAALIGAMKTMAIELGKNKIRVNAIAPGVIYSPMTQKLDQNILDEKIRRMDIPKLGDMNDVANLCMYLMSDYSSHITGQVIRIDGGIN